MVITMGIIEKKRLTIPIYLNTKIVFDMLATIEDGFSEVKNIQTSTNKNRQDGVEANVGTSNLFAFLNIGVKSNRIVDTGNGETIVEEKTHTPVSLFQKLKAQLDDNQLINRDILKLCIGDFVEIQGTLKMNPVIEMLSSLKEFIALANLFSDNKSQKNQSKRDKLMTDNRFNAQIDGLIKGLQIDGKKDIICEADSVSVVLPTDESYFLNNNMNEVTDGKERHDLEAVWLVYLLRLTEYEADSNFLKMIFESGNELAMIIAIEEWRDKADKKDLDLCWESANSWLLLYQFSLHDEKKRPEFFSRLGITHNVDFYEKLFNHEFSFYKVYEKI